MASCSLSPLSPLPPSPPKSQQPQPTAVAFISSKQHKMADTKPKFKFKKPKGSLKKKQLRRDSDENDAHVQTPSAESTHQDHDEPSALDKIRDLEKRRRLFSKNRGVDASDLGKATLPRQSADMDDDNVDAPAVQNRDLEERLKGTFDKGKLAGSNDMSGDDEGGILAKKHKRAMEEYIKSNLREQPVTDSSSGNKNNNGEFKTSADLEKEMYSELLVGESKGGMSPKKEEGDVGAGGAMMGGTGIAEVTLPIDDRIKAMKDTERAAMEYEKARKARLGIVNDEGGVNSASANDIKQSAPIMDSETLAAMVPMNFSSGPGKRKRKEISTSQPAVIAAPQQPTNAYNPIQDFQYPIHSSALPAGSFIEKNNESNLGSSYSHNFAQHNREWIEQKKDERQAEIDAIAAQYVEDGPEESKARLGFDAARRLARGEILDGDKKGEMKNEWDKKVSNDDRVWKTFMTNERNRR